MNYLTKFICSFLYYTGIFHLYYYTKSKNLSQILVYHSIENYSGENLGLPVNWVIRKDLFEKQVATLKDYFNIVSLDQYHDITFPRKCAITFDDGYRDNFSKAYPILNKLRIPATVFVATDILHSNQMTWPDLVVKLFAETKMDFIILTLFDSIEEYRLSSLKHKQRASEKTLRYLKTLTETSRNDFIDQLITELEVDPVALRQERLMLNWDEIIDMQKNGFNFGSHTHTHPILSKTDYETLTQELSTPKKLLENKLKTSIRHFAYPNGHTSDFGIREINELKRLGYSYSYVNFYHKFDQDPFIISRRPMDNDIGLGINGKFSKAVFLVQVSGLADFIFRRNSRIYKKEKGLLPLIEKLQSKAITRPT